eukprot:scaffold178087_cov23-Prasinocladus_malaysianus.AAC.1
MNDKIHWQVANTTSIAWTHESNYSKQSCKMQRSAGHRHGGLCKWVIFSCPFPQKPKRRRYQQFNKLSQMVISVQLHKKSLLGNIDAARMIHEQKARDAWLAVNIHNSPTRRGLVGIPYYFTFHFDPYANAVTKQSI